MKRIISLLIVMLMACSVVVFAVGTPEISLKAVLPGNVLATATFVGPPPLPIGILLGFRKTDGNFEKMMLKVPAKLQDPIRLQAELTKAVLKAPGDGESRAPPLGIPALEGPEEEETAPPTPKKPKPKIPSAEEKDGDDLGPPWTIEKCDQKLNGRCVDGYADLPNSCDCGGPVTVPLTQCTYCSQQKTAAGDPEICVDSNGVITADSGCVSPNVAIVIKNINTNEVLSVTADGSGGFKIVSKTAKPGHVLSATLAATGSVSASPGSSSSATSGG